MEVRARIERHRLGVSKGGGRKPRNPFVFEWIRGGGDNSVLVTAKGLLALDAPEKILSMLENNEGGSGN